MLVTSSCSIILQRPLRYLSCCNSLQKFIALKRGWKVEDIIRPKSHSTVKLPPFTEQDYRSQFNSSNTASNTTNAPPTVASSSSSANMTTNPGPTYGMPEVLEMNKRGRFYTLGVRLDEKGRAILSNPFSMVFSIFHRAFLKEDKKISDGLVVFYKASNKLDLAFNAAEVATVAESKKGIIIKQADKIDPKFIAEMSEEMENDRDRFGTSTQPKWICRAIEQSLKVFNKEGNTVSYHIDLLDFPYNLTPGTYQWKHTSDIDDEGLSSHFLELDSGDNGYFLVLGLEDDAAKDNLTDEEEEDVKAKARKKAEERMQKTRRKSAGVAAAAGRSSVDNISDDLSNMRFGKCRWS